MSAMQILTFIPRSALRSWAIILVATLASFALGIEQGEYNVWAVVVLGIAAVKVRLVGLDFMELRHAPMYLRLVFEGYCVALWAALSALYVMV